MVELKLTLTTTLPERHKLIRLSPDGRWLLIRRGEQYQAIETATGLGTALFALIGSGSPVLSPDGKYAARLVNQELAIINTIDGSKRSKVLPSTSVQNFRRTVCFTTASDRLWYTFHDNQGIGRLALLDIDTLEEFDSLSATDIVSDPQWAKWHEVFLTLHVPSDRLALEHVAGDSFLGVAFFHHAEGKIHPGPYHISTGNIQPFTSFACFSHDGLHFAAFDGPFLWIWQLPEMRLLGNGCRGLLTSFPAGDEKAEAFTMIGGYAIVAVLRREYRVSTTIEELRTVEIASGAVVSTYRLPRHFSLGYWTENDFLCLLAGNILVGVSGNETLIYQIELTQTA